MNDSLNNLNFVLIKMYKIMYHTPRYYIIALIWFIRAIKFNHQNYTQDEIISLLKFHRCSVT